MQKISSAQQAKCLPGTAHHTLSLFFWGTSPFAASRAPAIAAAAAVAAAAAAARGKENDAMGEQSEHNDDDDEGDDEDDEDEDEDGAHAVMLPVRVVSLRQ